MDREGSALIEELIRQTARRYLMLIDAERAVAGFSGGADFVALIHFLQQAEIPLLAAHVNHGPRGEASNAGGECMRRFCAGWQIPLRVLHAGVAKAVTEHREGIKAAGRYIRYRFFEPLYRPDDRITTAHTLSGQAETVLLYLARSISTKGLCGIPPMRGHVTRPLIGLAREQVEEYCIRRALPFVADASNFNRKYVHNRVRLGATPALKRMDPSFEQAVGYMTRLFAENEDYLSSLAAQTVWEARTPDGQWITPLSGLPRPTLSHTLRQIAGEAGLSTLTREHTEAAIRLLGAGSSKIDAGGG